MRRHTLLLVAGLVGTSTFIVSRQLTSKEPTAGKEVVKALPPVPSSHDASALQRYVAENAATKSPAVQDRVGAARIRLGYALARKEGYAKARQAFLTTAKTHKGTGAQSGAFGGVADQAAYQAAACLVGEGKGGEARKEFVRFLRERPLSPLAHAAYRRLIRLNGGETKPEWDTLLQTAVAKQEARIRFETSVCGPKCLEYLLNSPDHRPPSSATASDRALLSYQALAKLCGTTDSGTTIAGMRKGLKRLGVESWAASLNRRDLIKANLPAVLLQGDHYVVLERIDGDDATVWDPRYNSASPVKLPKLDDPDFSATLILLSRPEGL